MLHEILAFMTMNPFGSFIVIMSIIWFTFWLIRAFIERNKPVLNCECECCEPDEDEEETVAMGGEEEDDGHR